MICSRNGCSNEFHAKTHNQKYCSDDCCKIATSEKIKQKNLDRKARLSGKERICKTRGCSNILSRYRDGDFCETCLAKDDVDNKKAAWEIIKNVTS